MWKTFPLFLLAALETLGAAGAEPVDLLSWRQPVLGPVVSGKVYRVVLSPEVFNGCRSFPADIRILDEARRAWPFFLWTPEAREELVPLFATIGRKSGGPGGVVVQEVTIRVDDPKQPPRHNQLSILTGGHDFIRRIEVLGSSDGTTWKELGSGCLVDQMQPSRVSNRHVTYEASNAQRILLRIHPGAGHESEPMEVLDVQVAWHSRVAEPMQQVSLVPIPIQESEVREGVMTLAYDTGAQNRPIETLRIRVGEGDFVLPVKVFGRNSADLPWRWVADGGVYRIGRDGRDTIDLNGSAFRQLKIDLFQPGTKLPPIAAVIAEALPHYLVLESRGGSQPMLHYGADKIPLPRYDLQRRTTAADIAAAPLLQLGAARSNPHKVASGLSAYLKTMGLVAAVIIVCAALVVALRFLRSRLW